MHQVWLSMLDALCILFFFFSSRRRHTRCLSDWSSDVCSSDLTAVRKGSGCSVPAALACSLPWAARSGQARWVAATTRSEERRVGKECRYRWTPDHSKKKKEESRGTKSR